MKTILCLVGLILLVNYSRAQTTSIGVTAGATLASYKISAYDVSMTPDSKIGFNAGLVLSTPLSKQISFRPELKYVQKGGKINEEGVTDKLTLNYIELPLNFVFNSRTSKGMFFTGLGPSISMGIGGKEKWDYGDGEEGDEKVNFGNNADDDFKAFEFGINVLAGYQFAGGFFVSANYNTGLSNIAPDDPEADSKYHNRYFGINIGFMFKGKSKPAAPAPIN